MRATHREELIEGKNDGGAGGKEEEGKVFGTRKAGSGSGPLIRQERRGARSWTLFDDEIGIGGETDQNEQREGEKKTKMMEDDWEL